MVVDQARGLQAAIEQLREARVAVGVAGQLHQRGVLADLGAKVDLAHVNLPRPRPWLAP